MLDKIPFKEVFLSLLAGIIAGVLFKVLKFPLPAPPNAPAFMGIFGVWLGATLIKRLEERNQ